MRAMRMSGIALITGGSSSANTVIRVRRQRLTPTVRMTKIGKFRPPKVPKFGG